ncbi:MAG: radical SAM protein [Oligoflexia bacterium]|nr:radical SAM protein [Oligoflexia bacterium]
MVRDQPRVDRIGSLVTVPPTTPRDQGLRVIETYASVQGESTWAGLPCVFVRLAGCKLRCVWCDSAFTFTGGSHHSVDAVVEQASAYGIDLVELTGGEPLVQRQSIPLLERLVERGHTVLLETSGSVDIAPVPSPVHIIMDLKAPDSGEVGANRWENLSLLSQKDNLKVVLASRRDYEWARSVVRQHDLETRLPVLFSAVWGALDLESLSGWLVEDRLRVRLQVQLHKVIWPHQQRGV